MGEPTVARYPTSTPNLTANRVNQKTFVVSGTHTAVVQTITTSTTITGITAPCYLVNATTGEIIYAEGISGATFTTCTRGADGSTAQPMATGQILHAILVANDINQIIREVLAIATQADNANPMQVQSIASSAALRFRTQDCQIDHGILIGLGDDDHTQYHNDTRGDARYFTKEESAIRDNAQRFIKPDGQINHNALLNTHNLTTDINHDNLTGFVANEHIDWTSDQGATNIHSGNIPDLSATYAVAAKGVTNGDSHDHSGGDGAQIDHTGLSNIGTNAHSVIDSFISSKAAASGLASLDGSSKVVQDPANATATPTAGKIPIADGTGKLDGWITPGSYTLTYADILAVQVFS